MWNKLAYWMLFIFAIALFWAGSARAVDPNLQLWLEFEGNPNDSSGNGRNGTLNNSTAYIAGVFGQGLDLNVTGNGYVSITGYKGVLGTSAFTVATWVRTTGDGVIASWGDIVGGTGNGHRVEFRLLSGQLRVEHGSGNMVGSTAVNDGEWHHVALTAAANATLQPPFTKLYRDGLEEVPSATDTDPAFDTVANFDITLGRRSDLGNTTVRWLNADFDDFRIYDRELSAAEIYTLSKQPKPLLLEPANEAILDTTGVLLKWKAGVYAAAANGSEVFLGEDFEDVNSGTGGTSKGRTSNVFYLAASLSLGKVYYWKVDAVNDVHPVGRWSSEVFSFTIPDNTAWDPFPFDGAKYINPNVTLSWQPGLNGILNVVYFGTDFADVNTATGGDQKAETYYDPPGTLANDTVHYWRVDTVKADTSEVRGPVWSFTTKPVMPITEPNLVGYWKMDDMGSGTAVDFSGYDRDGTLRGGAHLVPGYSGEAVELDGVDDYVNIDGYKGVVGGRAFSTAAWIKTTTLQQFNTIISWGSSTSGAGFDFRMDSANTSPYSVRTSQGNGNVQANTPVNDGEWHHIGLTVIDNATASSSDMRIYVDGENDTVESSDPDTLIINPVADLGIGWRATDSDRSFDGLIDEVRLYDRVLTPLEMARMAGSAKAVFPKPFDGEQDVPLGSKLIWTPGIDPGTESEYTKHDVYFSTSFDDVNAGTVVPVRLTGPNEYTPSLDYYNYYYWRVDGVDAGNVAHRGNVWSFKAIYNLALIVDPNLLAWYKLDGDATDSSGYGRDLTEFGGPTYSAGYDGQAIQLDGVDDYAAYSFPERNMLAYTITLWAKAGTTGQNQYSSVFSNHMPNNRGFQLDVDGTDPGNYRYHDDFDRLFGPVTTGWVHLAVTFDGARTSLFYNGAFVDSNSTVVTDYAFNWYGVGMNRNLGNWFDGAIDDVRIYNRELSDADIVKVMRGDVARAWSPSPGDGVSGVSRTPILSWNPGDYAPAANGHYVYFGPDDPANMVLAPGQPQTPNNYTPSPLDLGRTYYWAVDEVNTTPPGSVNPGKIWEFTVADHLVLDDMETYDEGGPDWIFLTWKDGIGDESCTGGNGTGSALSLLTTGVSGSPHAMRYAYDNDGTVTLPCSPNPVEARAYYSKIEVQAADLPSAIGSDWTAGGAKALSLRFYGEPNSVLSPMWIELADNIGGKDKVFYGEYADETADMNDGAWHEWTIALNDFTGVDESNVKSVAIGIGTEGAVSPGGTGTLYIDDVRLYIPRCFPMRAKPRADFDNSCDVGYGDLKVLTNDWLLSSYDFTVAAPSDANLEAHYAFENNLLDSSVNARNADPNGTVAYAAGKVGAFALSLDGTNYAEVTGYTGVTGTGSRTISAWIKTTAPGEIVSWGTNTSGQKWILRVQDQAANVTVGAIRIEVNGGNIVGGTDLRDGAWHHVAAVLEDDGSPAVSEIKLYVDGLRDGTSSLTENSIATASSSDVSIGKAPWVNRPFYGQIDEVRIYSRALSQGEVASLAGLAGTVTQPVAGLLTTIEDTDLVDDETINFKDYATLLNAWLDEVLWPQ